MKVLMVSKALVVGAYQRKLEEVARHPGVQLVAVVPPAWRDRSYEMRLEVLHQRGYELVVSPIAVNGSFHLFFFPRLAQIVDEHHPDLLHIDEEPYNLATFLAARLANRRRIPYLFFTWQNLLRTYPLPFAWMERYVYRTAAWGIAGSETAARVLSQKGYRGGVAVVPQFGTDLPELDTPPDVGTTITPGPGSTGPDQSGGRRPFTIGFIGRLVPEKGVSLLVDACARLPLPFRLVIIGAGPALADIQHRATTRGIQQQVVFAGTVPSAEIPRRLAELDVIVLPSLSRPNWTEQFGRVLVEAMAAGVPVVGSTCGEIPAVIGDAGLVVPEGDAAALAAALERLAGDPALQAQLRARGRQRVQERFTHRRIAADTVQAYRRALERARAAPPSPA